MRKRPLQVRGYHVFHDLPPSAASTGTGEAKQTGLWMGPTAMSFHPEPPAYQPTQILAIIKGLFANRAPQLGKGNIGKLLYYHIQSLEDTEAQRGSGTCPRPGRQQFKTRTVFLPMCVPSPFISCLRARNVLCSFLTY